ncbi:aminopeptidase [Candidatus Izimaplasma bacterium ZiA1]|uniref:aminopeptidase n=1 Tax=Candidatus Izimoplasma sp. ZiA1 TaxID=2024899 RepID=UPI000BAA4A59|nr:aminopeptidase [Candidatus Izimaplasma bacterium ZiA1]
MPKLELLEKYAKLVVEVGANVQKDQVLVVSSSVETYELARLIVKAGYNAGARDVVLQWSDPYVERIAYDGKSIESLEYIPQWNIDQYKELKEQGACIVSITSPIPGLNKGVDPEKMQASGLAQMKAFSFVQDHMMGNHTQWTVIAAPNKVWAKQVFSELDEDVALEKLWDAILKASRVRETNDPIKEWQEHSKTLLTHNNILTDHQFDYLHFSNSLGTDLTVKLVENHIWAGGGTKSTTGIEFNPNIPTEENFTMPYKFGVNGKVVASLPLDYRGNLIEDFWLEFKDGKVVNYDAKKQLESLKSLLEVDEGSSYLGEVALISYDSPINNTGILFLNTLFDENASCHLALGRAYPRNVKGGDSMTLKELVNVGSNQSMVHSDFMFGSKDMQVIGTKKDGTKITIFKDGDYVI